MLTHGNEKDGKVGIGKLPNELGSVLDTMSNAFIQTVPDKSSTTYHTYYRDLVGTLKSQFDYIQHNPFWNHICDDLSLQSGNTPIPGLVTERSRVGNCIQHCVTEMNEMYYSNPTPNFETRNLYGAAANLIPHRDCLLFHFTGISFYRVIIGLTNNNNDISTEFVNLNLAHKINKGDYMIFDFDKTLHQVKKLGQQETPRILLKLHFIVCENCRNSNAYMHFAAYCYRCYYYVARYTEQIGTDPKTFSGFFFGLMWEWPFYSAFKYTVGGVFVTNVVILRGIYKIRNVRKLVLYSFANMGAIYLLIVAFYYFRYLLFGIK